MAREDVNIKVSSNVAEAIQMWKAMEAGPEGMANALQGMGSKGKESAKGLGEEVVGLAGKWATVAGAVAAVTAEIKAQGDAVRKLREERLAATNTVDEVMNRYQVQAGIPNGPAGDRARQQLMAITAQRKAGPLTGLMAAEMLGGAGASHADIVGGGLDEFLKLTTATNAAGKNVDQAELAKSLVMYLEANGLNPSGEGMRSTSLALQQIFGGTNLQLSNLGRFAPEAATIRKATGLDEVEMLAVFSQFLGTKEESGASVSFRSGALRMRTFGGYPERAAALKQLGLNPEDVDFEGEGYYGAMKRLQEGFAGVSPEKQDVIAARLFGQEGMGFYNVLLQPGAEEVTRQRVAMARSDKGAAERLALAESGRAAAARQAETQATAALYARNLLDPKVVHNRMQAIAGMLNLSEGFIADLDRTLSDETDLFGLIDVPIEKRIKRAAHQIGRWSGTPHGGLFGEQTEHIDKETAAGMLRGEIQIRIKTADGLHLPSEVEAVNLNDTPAAVQKMNGK